MAIETAVPRSIPKTFKIVILGDTNVGKSSLFGRYMRDEFKEAIANTIAVSNDFKEIIVDGNTVHLQIWDTAGQERFKSIVSHYYRDADGFIIVYDVNIARSFCGMKNLISELSGILNPKFTVLVGNKIDCASEEVMQHEESSLREYSSKNKFKHFFTSAKTGQSVNEVFEFLSKSLYYGKEKQAKPRNMLLSIKKKRKKFCW